MSLGVAGVVIGVMEVVAQNRAEEAGRSTDEGCQTCEAAERMAKRKHDDGTGNRAARSADGPAPEHGMKRNHKIERDECEQPDDEHERNRVKREGEERGPVCSRRRSVREDKPNEPEQMSADPTKQRGKNGASE